MAGDNDKPIIGSTGVQDRVSGLLTEARILHDNLEQATEKLVTQNTRLRAIRAELIHAIRISMDTFEQIARRVPDTEANDLLRMIKRMRQTADDYEKYS